MKVQELFEDVRHNRAPQQGDNVKYIGDKIPRPRTMQGYPIPAKVVSVNDEACTIELHDGRLFGVLTADCIVVPKPAPVAPNLELQPMEPLPLGAPRNFRYGAK